MNVFSRGYKSGAGKVSDSDYGVKTNGTPLVGRRDVNIKAKRELGPNRGALAMQRKAGLQQRDAAHPKFPQHCLKKLGGK